MGIEKLNVADTISEIFRDNTALCSKATEPFFRQFVVAIKTWGRRARWLSFFQVFIMVHGRPLKRNQDLILRLLMEDSDAVLDLTCDYSVPTCRLSKADARYGKTRLELILDNDHTRPVFSLLQYHRATLSILSMVAAGKNAENMGKLCGMIPFKIILKNILYTNVHADGRVETKARSDALRFVQAPWIRILVDIYLVNNDSLAVGQVQQSDEIFQSTVFADGLSAQLSSKSGTKRYLIEVFATAFELLASRLQQLDASLYSGNPALLDGHGDQVDPDVGLHLQYVVEVVKACSALYARFDTFIVDVQQVASAKIQSQRVRNGAVALYATLARFEYAGISRSLVELITSMTSQGIEGNRLEVVEDVAAPPRAPQGREAYFREGWQSFCTYFALRHGINPKDGEQMNNAIKDMALMFGCPQTHQNEDLGSLKELMTMLTDPECEDSMRLPGLKIIRAIIYMNPANAEIYSVEERNKEFERMLQNKPPSSLGEGHLAQVQAQMSKLGAVDVVLTCLESENQNIIMATLRLAVSLLECGNVKVQEQMAESLRHASSQPFFLKFRSLFQESLQAIRAQKRKVKQAAAAKAALLKAGITKKAEEESSVSLASSQVHMVEVMKTMRRMCMGSFKPLQDILRAQQLNHISYDFFNEAVQYLKNLEPELKDAIIDGDFEIVDGAMRGFLMLADAMRGPNLENQKAIAETGIFDLCDRIFARIRFEHVDKKTLDKDAVKEQNEYRSALKSAAAEALSALVEGVQDEIITSQMLALLNWYGLVEQLKLCYQSYERGCDLSKDNCLAEGLSYYFLLTHLKHYDKANEYILPALSHAPGKIIQFFQNRTGYIEIVRDERLERVYYQLPVECVAGGSFDGKPFEEMYVMDQREEFDKKSRDYIDNMVHITDKIQFHDRIRQSRLAWTVKRWDLIRKVNFLFTFTLHFLLVCGGYMPYYSKLAYAEQVNLFNQNDGERRKAAGGSDSSEPAAEASSFELTDADVYAFEKVAPKVEWIARIMSWMNLVTCGIRFFAFMHSEMPIIVRRILEEEAEDEPEPDTLDEAAAQEEAEEEQLDLAFVEHHGAVTRARAVASKGSSDTDAESGHAPHSDAWRSLMAGISSSSSSRSSSSSSSGGRSSSCSSGSIVLV